jgi:hypothetical protein
MKDKHEYDNVDALGTAKWFASAEKFEEAKIALDLVKPYCQAIPQLDAIGKVYTEIREYQDSLEIALRIRSMVSDPQSIFDSQSNIIRAYINLNMPYEAMEYTELNLKYKPDDQATLMDKAMIFFLLNRKKEAEVILRDCYSKTTDPDIAQRIRFNLGTYDLANGNFKEGLKGFLLEGRHLDIWKEYPLPPYKQWKGGFQPGKTILMTAEGGIGDEIINIRFMEFFKAVGMDPVWYTSRLDIADIFEREGHKVIRSLKQYDPSWLWCYSMAVPSYLGVHEDDLWHGPYLKPKRAKEPLAGNLKIGFKCMGNPKYDQDLHRTIPYKEVLDCLPKSATIYSFHVDEEIPDDRIMSLRNHIKTWDDTLDYLDQMDVLVSSCTGLVHAASAMGVKTVVMVPILNYYVWAYPTRHSKWYSENTTILRQQEYNNWNAPIQELKEYMNENFPQG